MEFTNFEKELGGKSQHLVDAYEPGQDEVIDDLPKYIEERGGEMRALADVVPFYKGTRDLTDVGMWQVFRQFKDAKYHSDRILGVHLI